LPYTFAQQILSSVSALLITWAFLRGFTSISFAIDVYNITRKAGEEWLVTHKMAELHLQNVHEEVMGEVLMTVLTCEQWCIVLDPVGSDGKNQYGIRQLRKGECSFFLQPGEKLEAPGIQPIYVLGQEEALLLRAQEKFVDEFEGKQVERTPGDRWMIHGPCDYVPVVEVAVVEKRRAIPLDENEGICKLVSLCE